MATPNVGILTNAGKNLIDQVNAGKTKITFSKIVFSSMDNSQLSDMQVKALTAITPQEVVVSSPETTLDTNSGETRIRATGTNEKLADGVYVKTYGVFAKDDTGSEILYGVTVSPNPNYFPAYDGVTPQAVTYSYKTVIQESSNITMTNSKDVYASQEDLTEALQPYAKTVDVNQQLDKKVNIADMRKPASDVAGIEEVNAKQDKIGYTPADDSKVVHTSDMRKPASDVAGIEEVNALQSQVNNSAVGTNLYTDTKNFDNLVSWWGSGWWAKATDTYKGLAVIQTTQDWWGISQYIQVKKGDVLTYSAYAKYISGTGTSAIYWTPDNPTEVYSIAKTNPSTNVITITDSWQRVSGTIVAASDGYLQPRLERTNSNTNTLQIAGIKVEKGSVATDWCPNPAEILTKADDSKVAHLSGANNFDTVPTVNNNPLLLASSLPSDLARTSQQTNFTAGLQSGGVDVATAADLKSVEDKAWRELDLSGTSGRYTGKIRIKIDDTNKTIYLDGAMYFSDGMAMSQGDTIIDLSKVVNSITSAHGYVFFLQGNNEHATLSGYDNELSASTLIFRGTKINLGSNVSFRGAANYILPFPDPGKPNIYVTYDKLV